MKINLQQLIHHYQLHLHHLQEKSRLSLIIASVLTLFFCKQISGYYCNYDTKIWFQDFVVVERISMLFLLLSVFKKAREICWLAAELLLFFLAQDVIDRLYFNVKEINLNDYIMIGMLTVIAGIKILNKYKK